MYKAIHHDGYKSLVDVSEYLARHDIVYRRPALKPYEGLPVGDGKMGGLLYHEPNGIAIQVNHTDAIDFAPDGNMQAWSWETEERNTAPVACAVISIQSSLPCFDWVYLQDYEERLCLAAWAGGLALCTPPVESICTGGLRADGFSNRCMADRGGSMVYKSRSLAQPEFFSSL